MSMKVTILGSGQMMPTKRRHPSSYLVESGKTKILLDCGHTTLARLIDMDVDPFKLTAVCITHFHTDHFGDVHPLLHALWVEEPQPTPRKKGDITIIGPQTIKERLAKLREVFWPEPKEAYEITVKESKGGEKYNIGELSIQAFATKHVPWFPSIGYRIKDSAGKSLFYTGDLAGDQTGSQLLDGLQGVDLLIVEASSPKPSAIHFTPQQALQLAQKRGVKKVVFTHLRDKYLQEFHEIVSGSNGFAQIAEDNLVIEL